MSIFLCKLLIILFYTLFLPLTLFETISWLINEYGPAQNDSNQDLVLEAIKSLKLANFESFDEYYGSLKQLFSRYVSVGGRLRNEDKKKHLLRGAEKVYPVECKALRTLGSPRLYC